MNPAGIPVAGPTAGRAGLSQRMQADLLLLAFLHGRALRRAEIVELWSRCYDGLLQLRPEPGPLRSALNRLCDCLTAIPTCATGETERCLDAAFHRIHGETDRAASSADTSDRAGDLAAGLRLLAQRLGDREGAARPAVITDLIDRELRPQLEAVAERARRLDPIGLYGALVDLSAAYLTVVRELTAPRGGVTVEPAAAGPIPAAHDPTKNVAVAAWPRSPYAG